VSVYILVGIIKKRLNIPASPYIILQILSVTVFEAMLLKHILADSEDKGGMQESDNRLNLFD